MDKIATLPSHEEEKLKELEKVLTITKETAAPTAGAATVVEQEATAINNLKAFHEAFSVHYKHVADTINDEAEEADKEAADAKEAEKEAAELEEEVKALEAELEEMNKESGSGDSGADRLKAIAGQPLADYFKAQGDLAAKLTVLNETLKHVAAEPGQAFKLPLDEIHSLAAEWETLQHTHEDEVTKLVADADALVKTADSELTNGITAQEVQDLWEAVKQEGATTLQSSCDEDKERHAAREESYKEFEFERSRLLLWCRQQKTNLDGMSEADHIQEFCASLLNNYTAMEENFTIIYERAVPLLPDLKIQAALLEVNEVWLNLQVSSYDRLRFTLLEIHANSKLEDEVRAFSHYSQRAGNFLKEFSKLLATPTDADSKDVVKPVIDDCATLLRQFEAHKHLTEHLREFALRMECFRDNYGALKRAVLSRLTFLAVTPSLATSQRRKDEYLGRMKELRSWVDVKSQGESWSDIHERVLKIRDLIAQEQASLNALPEKKDN